MPLSPVEFSRRIKDKYPEYEDMDDVELSRRVVEKYPDYKAEVDFSLTQSRPGSEPSKKLPSTGAYRGGAPRNAPAISPKGIAKEIGEIATLEKRGMRGAFVGAATRDIERAAEAVKPGFVPKGTDEEIAAGAGEFIGGLLKFTLAAGVFRPIAAAAASPFVSKIAQSAIRGGIEVAGGSAIMQTLHDMSIKGEVDPNDVAIATGVGGVTGLAFGAAIPPGVAALKAIKRVSEPYMRRIQAELAGLQFRAGKALGIKQETGLVPLNIQQAVQEGHMSVADAARASQEVFEAELAKRRGIVEPIARIVSRNPNVEPMELVRIQVETGTPEAVARQNVQASYEALGINASILRRYLDLQPRVKAGETPSKVGKVPQKGDIVERGDELLAPKPALEAHLKAEARPPTAQIEPQKSEIAAPQPSKQPDAVFIGFQEDPDTGAKIPFFNVTKPGHPRLNSTVSRETLEAEGLRAPEVPAITEKAPEVKIEGLPERPPLKGWKNDPGAIPGETTFYKGDIEKPSAAIIENEPSDPSRPVTYSAFAGETPVFNQEHSKQNVADDQFLTAEDAALAAEDVLKSKSQATETPGIPGNLADKGGRKLGDFEAPASISTPTKEFKLFERVEGLIKKYSNTIGEGYLPRGARGVFYSDTENIRIGGINDLSVAAHEIAHYLDISKVGLSKKLLADKKPQTKVIRGQLSDFYLEFYPTANPKHSKAKRITEGFATLLQKYTESPNTIRNKYPDLVKAFFDPEGQYHSPVFTEVLEDLKGIVSDYASLDALGKVGSRVTKENPQIDKESFLTTLEKFRTEIADKIYPTEVLAKKAGVAFTSKDPSLWLRAFNPASGVALQNIIGKRGYWGLRKGEFVKVHDYNWKNLIDELGQNQELDSFSYYLVARREHFSWKELDQIESLIKDWQKLAKENPSSKEVAAKEIKNLKTEHAELKAILDKDPFTRQEVDGAYEGNKKRFSALEKKFDALTEEDLKTLNEKDVQLLDDDQLKNMLEKEGYASFKRQFIDELVGEELPSINMSVGGTKVSSLLSRTGSSRTIINPVYSALRNHFEITRKAMKQAIYNKMAGLADGFPSLFQRQQLQAVPLPDGRLSFPQEKDGNIMMARENYKRAPYLVDAKVKQTLDEILTPQSMEIFDQIVQAASTFFTKGTTGAYPAFALTNIGMDQITAAANTRNKYLPIYDSLKLLTSIFQKSPESKSGQYLEEYLVLGGDRQTLVGWQDLSPDELFKKILGERTGILKAADAINSGVDIFAVPSKYSEIITRATEYAKARASGKTQFAAMEEAGRVTAPFHHIGRFGGSKTARAWVRSMPFFNASLQVLDQAFRTLETPRGRERYAFVAMATGASMVGGLAWIMAGATKDQKENYLDLEANEIARYIFLPHPNGKDLIKFRIPETLSIFGTITNLILADTMMNAKYDVSDYMAGATSWLPRQLDPNEPLASFVSWIPQIIKPAIMAGLGFKDFPKIIPLEGAAMRNLPSEMRINEGTSKLAKLMGSTEWAKTLDLSPIKIDFLITGYAGRASGFLTLRPGVFQPLNVLVRKHYLLNGRRVEKYYRMKKQSDEDMRGVKINPNQYTKEQRASISKTHGQLGVINKAFLTMKKMDLEKNREEAFKLREKILEKLDEIVD